MTWVQILLKIHHHLEMLFACKASSEEDILGGFFSFSGVESLYPVSGIMNADKYIDVIQRKVMRDMQTAFPGGGGIFQQDLDPCYAAKKVKKVFQKKQIKVLDCLVSSLDLKPVENLGIMIINWLSFKDYTNLTKLIKAVFSVWHHDEETAKSYQNLLFFTPKRVKQVVNKKGGHTSY